LSASLAAAPAVPASAAPGKDGKPQKAQKSKSKKKDKGEKGSKATKPKEPEPSAKAPPKAEPERPLEVALDLHRATLENGLRVVVNVDHTSPTVAIAVVYDVGSRNEEHGRSGFAHLFEHMMFEGSKNVAKGEHFKLVAGRGGELNGTTNPDRTNYFEVLPESELALGLWLEADRMRSLDVSQENFENQRKVVEEEYRLRVSNAAYQPSRIRREELVYQGFWPYEHATIGSMADLDAAELAWVQAFHASHYGPNNAVLTVAGDVDADAAIAMAKRYFEDIPRVSPPAYQDAPLPDQVAERRARVEEDHARTPGVFYGWAIPSGRAPDHYALEAAADLLADGESSRLHQTLVRERGLALSVNAGTWRRRGPDLFQIDVIAAGGAKTAEIEKAVEAEIQALATRGPSDAELAKVRRRAGSRFVLELASNLGRARWLGEFELYYGDARLLSAELTRYLAVGKDDIKRAVAHHLGPTRRTLVEARPPGMADEPEAEPHHAPASSEKSKPAAGEKKKGKKEGKAKKGKKS
jgi:predicted Zn-dependent peptidase